MSRLGGIASGRRQTESITACQPPSLKARGGGGHQRVAQQALGGHHHQRQRVDLQQGSLAAQQVEIIGRRGTVGHAQVLARCQVEEALQAPGGMIGALAFVTMRQKHDQRGELAPLVARRDDKFVDHRLGIADEITVLRLPDHQICRGPGRCSQTQSPARAYSDSGELWISKAARAWGSACRGMCTCPVSCTSCSTAWRWLKVPRSASCPVIRIGHAVFQDGSQGQSFSQRPNPPPANRASPACFRGAGGCAPGAGGAETHPAGAAVRGCTRSSRSAGTAVRTLRAAPGGAGAGSGSLQVVRVEGIQRGLQVLHLLLVEPLGFFGRHQPALHQAVRPDFAHGRDEPRSFGTSRVG